MECVNLDTGMGLPSTAWTIGSSDRHGLDKAPIRYVGETAATAQSPLPVILAPMPI